jgi:single-strand DNA-binding protein
MNKVVIVGRLTADPQLNQTRDGISSCRFNVAVNRKFKNEHTGEYDADFISCVAWRQTAEFVSRYFSKGKMIALEGSIRTGKYQDKNHPDVTHYTTDVFVDNVEFVGGKNDSGGGGQSTYQSPRQQSVPQQPAPDNPAMSYGEFEELLGEGDMPF